MASLHKESFGLSFALCIACAIFILLISAAAWAQIFRVADRLRSVARPVRASNILLLPVAAMFEPTSTT
jgi:hypothetical protein